MNTNEWLERNVHGFAELSDEERTAIAHFTFLWSLFEARALSKMSSSHKIHSLARRWSAEGCLKICSFDRSLHYFRQRYFNGGDPTSYFMDLNLRSNDCKELVCSVLKGDNTNPADSVAALLIVVYRLRNNLFHGEKWSYLLKGQLSNFEHANFALMEALSVDGLPLR